MTHKISVEEAKSRFGELIAPRTHTYMHFETEEGIWRPEYDDRMRVTEYRLYRPARPVDLKMKFWPKKRK